MSDIFVCLTSLSMIISRSIHVAENDIISFSLWLSNSPLYKDVLHLKTVLFTHSCAGSSLLLGCSLVAAGGGCSPVVVHGLLIEVASLVAEHGL